MKKSNPFIRILTMLFFLSMVALFVAYQAGFFEKESTSSLDTNVYQKTAVLLAETEVDTPVLPLKKDSLVLNESTRNEFQKTIMSSSKSRMPFQQVQQDPSAGIPLDTKKARKVIFSSSKFAILPEMSPFEKARDSLRPDSLKPLDSLFQFIDTTH